ncbi:MAG: rod shape-determining protein MreC [Gammaproteobacteria bacterium RIFCSPHIGHO2_12_FULL_45_12]|nr:MAG: rod shape-determining protein MreC [Gammaproteobacteria bacterium RIFCSPHIGHO2_12_FULL_45_12]
MIRSIFTHESHPGLRAFFLVILSIGLMVMDSRLESFASIREAMSLPLAPLQYVVNWPTKMIDTFKSAISTHDALVEENLKLKADQLLLSSQLQRLMTVESENNYLKSLMQSSRQVKRRTLIAELLAVSTEPFVRQITLDKGSRDGVYVGQPVIDATGVMGQVIRVGPLISRVLLVTDPDSGVAVQSARNGIRAVASGDSYTGKLRLLYLPKTADVRVGDVMVTSGLGDHYPEGYPVGRVISVSKDPTSQFAAIQLQASARIGSSRQVLLVWYQRNV